MPLDAHIDTGVREVVALLNGIPGVATRASCEGMGCACRHPRHAYWAYVLFRYPMPLRFREYLMEELGELGRVEDDGVYSRWQERNSEFLARLEHAARSYAGRELKYPRTVIWWRLPKLRACLARPLISGQALRVGLCLVCRDLTFGDHPLAHQQMPLLSCASDRLAAWFAEFASLPPNRLESDLVRTHGWADLITRSEHGDFGPSFHRRWLRFRARKLAELATRQLRLGMEAARRHCPEIDFFYSDTHAALEWRSDGVTPRVVAIAPDD